MRVFDSGGSGGGRSRIDKLPVLWYVICDFGVRSSVVERRPFKASVAGPNPAGPSKQNVIPTEDKRSSKNPS